MYVPSEQTRYTMLILSLEVIHLSQVIRFHMQKAPHTSLFFHIYSYAPKNLQTELDVKSWWSFP